jgi:hypothetical protein
MTTTQPGVSVVIPTRGRPDLVRKAVASVVGQDYDGPVQCLVVHDQEEPDRSLEALSRPGRDVTVVLNTGQTGLAGSRNFGLRLAVHDFIASCDDDDWWEPGKTRHQVARLTSEPHMLVVGTGIRLLMAEGRTVEWLGSSEVVTQKQLFRSRRKELHSSTLMMRRRAFDLAGTYDENLPQSYAEDYEWLLRAAQHGSIGVVQKPLATIKKDGPSWFRERSEVIAAALEYLLAMHPEIKQSRKGHARILGQIAFARANQGRRKDALKGVGRSLAVWPFAPQALLAFFQLTFQADPRVLLRGARVVGRGLS